MSKPSVKAALIQHENQGDADANLALIGEQIAAAAAQGAQLILLQELHNGPYFCQTEAPSQFSTVSVSADVAPLPIRISAILTKGDCASSQITEASSIGMI